MSQAYRNFRGSVWRNQIDVRDFILNNVTPYTGTGDFLVGPTERTTDLWKQCLKLLEKEHAAGGVSLMPVLQPPSQSSAGYIDK